ncbi:protein kinase domain-containing protein [Streptomyces sparsogenes]|uniref:protein kinase domain-containing protein n=1 Tax=Streptomyces sparsogenes TaxID=67365 RepID=UPI00340C0724
MLGRGAELASGRYVVREELGRGGMAAVYRAHDTALDRVVAVKVMHGELGRDPSFRRRFKREAQLAARLAHAHVVAVHDIGEEPDPGGAGEPMPYLVMEFVEGESLRDRLRRGPVGVDEALRIVADVLAGLEASHARGIVHRDIKPANVMLTPDGGVKVMDFGIARAVQSAESALTGTGTVLGSAPYMAPEQATGGEIDGRTDLYAVGVLLFQLLSARLPFEDDSVPALLYKHVHVAPPALAEVGVDVPPAVQELVTRALAKDPAARYADAGAMREQVEAARAGRPGPAGSAEQPGSAGRAGATLSAGQSGPAGQPGPARPARAAAPHAVARSTAPTEPAARASSALPGRTLQAPTALAPTSARPHRHPYWLLAALGALPPALFLAALELRAGVAAFVLVGVAALPWLGVRAVRWPSGPGLVRASLVTGLVAVPLLLGASWAIAAATDLPGNEEAYLPPLMPLPVAVVGCCYGIRILRQPGAARGGAAVAGAVLNIVTLVGCFAGIFSL